jgi:hypothetical protein
MTLAPGERLALARIEDALRYSDPRLATMLTTFTLPLTLRLRMRGERLARSRVNRVVAVSLGLAAMCVSLLGWLLPAPRGQPVCAPGGPTGTCQPAAGSASRPGHGLAGSTGRPGAQTAANPVAVWQQARR